MISLLSFIISPMLTAGFAGLMIWKYVLYLQEYFLDRRKHEKYSLELAPQLAFKTYINVGYEIPEDQVEKHIEMLNRLDAKDKTAIQYLATQEKLVKTSERHRLVGISKNQLTTHFWLIGTTGAGKTSFVMQLTKLLAEQGGGMIFVDGKADTAMVFKMITILKEQQREQDFYLINFLPKENFREHTNTFNPIADMNHTEIVEFFMSAKGEASGDQAYWAERGKALLQAIVYPLYYRKKYHGERFTIVTLSNVLSDLDRFLFYVMLNYAILYLTEDMLSIQKELNIIVEKAKESKIPDIKFPITDAITYYFKMFPYEKKKVSDKIDVSKLDLLYEAYQISSNYVLQIKKDLWDVIEKRAMLFIEEARKVGLDILKANIEDINKLYNELVKSNPNEFTLNMNAMKDALQQHAYAQQQWTALFGTLTQFSNIFGSNDPEIDLVDILRNNKFLYVLLPALAGSNQTTNTLGKLILAAIRKAISTALGEAIEGLDDSQRAVLKKRITPIPLGLLVLDEYGAYPIAGIDTILAQVRSINISTILATQDYTSARADGKDENAVKRAWANTQKLILRVKDNETIKQIEEIMPERKKIKYSYMIDKSGEYVFKKTDNVSVEKEKAFDSKLLPALKNGLGIFLTEKEAVLTQIFWADAKEAGKINLNHSIMYR